MRDRVLICLNGQRGMADRGDVFSALVEFRRSRRGLPGTKVGCGEGDAGPAPFWWDVRSRPHFAIGPRAHAFWGCTHSMERKWSGRSINPGIDRGQVIGGFVQGMGWSTTEELLIPESGKLLSDSANNEKIPSVDESVSPVG